MNALRIIKDIVSIALIDQYSMDEKDNVLNQAFEIKVTLVLRAINHNLELLNTIKII